MELYNLEKLIKIRVIDKRESTWYYYQPYHKSWWRGTYKEGIYSYFGEYYGTDVDNHSIEDGKVYKDPECILFFEDDFTYSVKFKNIGDAKTHALDIDKLFYSMTGNHLIEL